MAEFEDQFIADERMRRLQDSIAEQTRGLSSRLDAVEGRTVDLDANLFANLDLIEDIELTTTPADIAHALGAEPRGVILVKTATGGATVVYMEAAAIPKDNISLSVDIDSTVSVVVF